jgi:hypothetical protein
VKLRTCASHQRTVTALKAAADIADQKTNAALVESISVAGSRLEFSISASDWSGIPVS